MCVDQYTPAGSNNPDMLKVERNVPWLLTVAASGVVRRVVTNIELGSKIFKPDVSAPCANTLTVVPHGDVGYTNTQIVLATSLAAVHASSLAAMVKKAHQDWSTSEIKSAIVTSFNPVGPEAAIATDSASYFVTPRRPWT